MRKISVFLAILVMIAALSACGNNGTQQQETAQAA